MTELGPQRCVEGKVGSTLCSVSSKGQKADIVLPLACDGNSVEEVYLELWSNI